MRLVTRMLPLVIVFLLATLLFGVALTSTMAQSSAGTRLQNLQPVPTPTLAPLPRLEASLAPQEAPWSPSSRVNDDPVSARQGAPDIAADADGNVLAVWEDERSGFPDLYFALRPVDGPWGLPTRVGDFQAASGISMTNPSIAVDADGNAYAVWQDERNEDPDIFFATRPSTDTWGANVQVSADLSDTNQISPSIAVDAEGNAYAVWADDRNGDFDIFFAYRPYTGTWELPVQVSDAVSGTTQTEPAIAVDAEGNAYAVWTDDRDGDPDIFFATRPFTGTWEANIRASDAPSLTQQVDPDIAVDPEGNAYAVWTDDRDGVALTYFATRPVSGTWGASSVITNPVNAAQVNPAIAVEAGGNAIAVWQDLRDDGGDIYVAVRPAGGPWGNVERVNDDGGLTLQARPSVAVNAGGTAFGAWEDQRNGNADVYLTQQQTGGSPSPNEMVNDDPLNADQVQPDVAVDAAGNADAVWQDERNGDDDIYSGYRATGGSWGVSIQVGDVPTSNGTIQAGPAIALDSSSNAYAVWQDDRSGDPDILSSRQPSGAGAWDANVQVSDAPTISASSQVSPAIAVDSAGNAYAVWADDRNGDPDIFFAFRPAGGAWAANSQVSDAPGGTVQDAPAIGVDPDGNAYAVWKDDRNGDNDIYFAYRPTAGSWQPSVQVSDAPTGTVQDGPAIAVDPDGNAYAVWQDDRNGDDDIYFAYRPTAGSWQPSLQVSDAPTRTVQSEPDIAIDPKGNAYAVWKDDRNGDNDIYFAYRPGYGTWGTNTQVNDDAGGTDHRNPAIAVDAAGNAYVVWDDNRDGQRDIFFAEASHADIFDINPWLAVNTTNHVLDGSVSSMAALEANPGPDDRTSLREALVAANNTPGEKKITFAIPTGDPGYNATDKAWTITPSSPLAWLNSGQLTLDATTQGVSAHGGPSVVLNGSLLSTGAGLNLPGGDNTVSGFVIHSFPGHGIAVWSQPGNTIIGNYVGTDVTGMLDLGNGDRGISVGSSGNRIGGTLPGEGNIVAFNTNQGINLEIGALQGNTISRNSIFSNDFEGIRLEPGANQGILPPQIISVTESGLSGTACLSCTVEIFSDDEDEGRYYEGTTVADGSGNWTWIGIPAQNRKHTATATDLDGNTSAFSGALCSGDVGPTDVTASPFGSSAIELDWTPNGSASYEIWKGTRPYFTPDDGDPGTSLQGTTMAPPFIVAGVLGDPTENNYFLVSGLSACAGSKAILATGYSNRTGEFDFGLIPGIP